MTSAYLGIDVGTGSTKGVVVDADGRVLAKTAVLHATSRPRPGWVEQDPDTWWRNIRRTCQQLGVGDRPIRGVGVSGLGPALVVTDADDTPLRPAILYGVDTRAISEEVELTERFGAEAILTRGGSRLSSQALGPKLLWLARHEPSIWARVHHWYTTSSFIVSRLTGVWVLDHHSASQCDPFYNLDDCAWNQEWAASVLNGLDFPPLRWPTEVVGAVSREASEWTGLAARTPVIAGTIDAWAEAVSAAVRGGGDMLIMYGSTMFVIVYTTKPGRDPNVWTTTGVDQGTMTRSVGMATSGAITDWVKDLTRTGHGDLLGAAGRAPAGADGLLLLPYFAGERSPIFDPHARGVLVGLTLNHGRGEVYRAVLEGVAFGLRQNLDALGPSASGRVLAAGGGANPLWTQIVSDVCGITQEVPMETVGAAYGSARMAAEATGDARRAATWNPTAQTVEPNANYQQLYDARYRMYLDLHDATRDLQHALAASAENSVEGS